MMFYPIKKIDENNIKEMQQSFDIIFASAEKRDELWLELKKSIDGLSFDQLFKFNNTYTKWFSLLAYKKFNGLEIEDVLFVLSRVSFFIALYNEVDLLTLVTDYLNLRSIDEEDMMKKYEQIKNVIFNSQEVIYYHNDGQAYRVRNFAEDMKRINNENDGLFVADVFSNLSSFVAKYIKENDLSADQETVVVVMKSTMDFLIGVDKEYIWYMVEGMYHPLPDEEADDNQDLNAINEELSETKLVEGVKSETTPEVETVEPIESNDNEVISYITIKYQLEKQFSYDESGELQPIEEVLSRLSELAEENDDENIEELYFFDEDSGKFVWNEELLNQK